MNFLSNEKFIIPLLATVGASFTVMGWNSIMTYRKEQKKKLYATAYMSDMCYRILYANLILKTNTIIPHIKGIKRIIEGDQKLLEKTFLADEFDILTEDSLNFNTLSEEYKILLGRDNIELIQNYIFIAHMHQSQSTKTAFNEFVKLNLKSQHSFNLKTPEEQLDILSTYWDYLERLLHQLDRTISLINIALPNIKKYSSGLQFKIFSKKNINEIFEKIDSVLKKYQNDLPPNNFMEKLSQGGGMKNML